MEGLSTTDPADELARLRRRAYGPDADIASDPHALSRLDELETRRRVIQDDNNDAGAAVPSGAPTGPDLADEGQATTLPTVGATRWTAWHRVAPWVGVAAVAVVAALVGLLIPAALAPKGDITLRAAQVQDPSAAATLMQRSVDLDLGAPTVYESYDDLQVLSASNDAGMTCLLVSWANHWSDFSCTPKGLVPVVDYDAYLGSPILLDDPLPPGTVIRFELHDDGVEVTLREPPKGRVSADQRGSGPTDSANDSRPSAA